MDRKLSLDLVGKRAKAGGQGGLAAAKLCWRYRVADLVAAIGALLLLSTMAGGSAAPESPVAGDREKVMSWLQRGNWGQSPISRPAEGGIGGCPNPPNFHRERSKCDLS